MFRKIVVTIGVLGLLGYGVNARALERIVGEEEVKTVQVVEELVQLADNVIILFDHSSSMNEKYDDSGMTELQAATRLLQQRVEWFPDVFPDLKVGLYSYTPPPSVVSFDELITYYPVQPFNKEKLLSAIDQMPKTGDGPTLLQNALIHLDKVLAGLSGHTEVVLFTDGAYSRNKGMNLPVEKARALAQKYDVSFQLISTADNKTNEKILKAVASINERSRVYSFKTFLDRPEVYSGAVFVLEENYFILSETREKVVGYKLDPVLFALNKTVIKPEFSAELDAAGKMLEDNPDGYIVLAGFTDDRGTEEYNYGLARRRAEAVADYLSRKFQIGEERLVLLWYGEEAPVASNDSAAGRSQNRRVGGFILGVQ